MALAKHCSIWKSIFILEKNYDISLSKRPADLCMKTNILKTPHRKLMANLAFLKNQFGENSTIWKFSVKENGDLYIVYCVYRKEWVWGNQRPYLEMCLPHLRFYF